MYTFLRTGWPLLTAALLLAGPLAAQAPPGVDQRLQTLEETVRRLEAELARERKDKDKKDAPKTPEPKKDDKDKKDDKKSPPPEPEAKTWDVGANRKMAATWNNGVLFETEDRAFRLAVGGVIQFDLGFYDADRTQVRSVGVFNNFTEPARALQDGMDFRRARLRMGGVAWEQIEFFAQYEFANATDLRQRTLGIPNPGGVASPNVTNFDPAETTGFNEVYVGLVKLPLLGNVRVGRHRESLNFVTATADTNQIWLERGLLFEAFNGNTNFSNGVTVQRNYLDGRAYSFFGVFQQNSSSNRQFATVGDGNYAYTGRLTCLPVWEPEGQLWVHLGVDVSHRNLAQDNVRLRARPDVRVGSAFQVPNLVDSGNVFSRDAQQIANAEFAAAWGPWTCAAEATACRIPDAFTGGLPRPDGRLPTGVRARGTYVTSGAYAELMYFLTPDHRPYAVDRPGYARVTPSRNFFLIEGDDGRWALDSGAWEVGVRYDYVDLTNSGINGGTAHGLTAAVNWYLSSNTRVQTNLSWMRRDFSPPDNAGRLPGDVTALGIRFNCDF